MRAVEGTEAGMGYAGRAGHCGILGSCVGSAYMRGQPRLVASGRSSRVPGFVAVDLAQPVVGAVLRTAGRGIEGPDVDRVPGHVSRRVRSGDPSRSFRFRSILGDRLTEKLLLVLGSERHPAT